MRGPGGASDESRFGEALLLHGAALRRVAAVYDPDPSRREDLFQEICLAIWQALPRFEGRSSLRTFLFRIAHNRGLTHRWKRQLSRGMDLDEAGDRPHPDPDPEEAAASRQRSARLQEAVLALPLGQRQVIAMVLEGCAHAEIADILGLTENIVAVRVNRAKAALKKTLAQEGAKA